MTLSADEFRLVLEAFKELEYAVDKNDCFARTGFLLEAFPSLEEPAREGAVRPLLCGEIPGPVQ